MTSYRPTNVPGTFIPSGAVNGDPNEVLGAPSPNEAAYTLGVGGSIVLRFTDNALTGSGDNSNDLHIFEVGPQVEDTFVEISTNGVDFLSVGKVFGSTSSIDIDPFLTAASLDSVTKFSFVRLTDDVNEGTRTPNTQFAGADIDAIGAITSAPPVTIPDTTPVPLPASALMLLASVGVLGAATRLTARRKA